MKREYLFLEQKRALFGHNKRFSGISSIEVAQARPGNEPASLYLLTPSAFLAWTYLCAGNAQGTPCLLVNEIVRMPKLLVFQAGHHKIEQTGTTYDYPPLSLTFLDDGDQMVQGLLVTINLLNAKISKRQKWD